MGLMLDTNVFIFSERSGTPIDFSQWKEHGDVYMSSITVSELLVGVHYAHNEAKRARRSAFVEFILGKVPVLAFDREVARIHACLFMALAKKGQMIGTHDLIIAATALFHNCAVLTDNTDEFERVAGLDILSYIKPS
ncbi:MAG: type II toxin-antitoxin system VapC family toxin [SAR324 cluster bacterium]|nr:type II toxin-antitoxin system VapC family toxin [SAR324 cluster bacterium]